jgi:hypothetical protein
MTIAEAGRWRCFRVSDERLVIASFDGRSWLMDVGAPGLVALPVSEVAARRPSLAAAAVEGAIAAGLSSDGQNRSSQPFTLLRYVRWLTGNYVFAAQTPGLFRRGAERLRLSGRIELAAFALEKAREESGHAVLARRDLEALGLPGVEMARLIQPPSAKAFVKRFRGHVESPDPVSLFGFSYCLERMAVARDEAFIRSVQSVCPPGVQAFRFLKVHSALGSDTAHVYEQLARFDALSDTELSKVVRAAYATARMLARQRRIDRALSDDEIGRRLRLGGFELSCAGRGTVAAQSELAKRPEETNRRHEDRPPGRRQGGRQPPEIGIDMHLAAVADGSMAEPAGCGDRGGTTRHHVGPD